MKILTGGALIVALTLSMGAWSTSAWANKEQTDTCEDHPEDCELLDTVVVTATKKDEGNASNLPATYLNPGPAAPQPPPGWHGGGGSGGGAPSPVPSSTPPKITRGTPKCGRKTDQVVFGPSKVRTCRMDGESAYFWFTAGLINTQTQEFLNAGRRAMLKDYHLNPAKYENDPRLTKRFERLFSGWEQRRAARGGAVGILAALGIDYVAQTIEGCMGVRWIAQDFQCKDPTTGKVNETGHMKVLVTQETSYLATPDDAFIHPEKRFCEADPCVRVGMDGSLPPWEELPPPGIRKRFTEM